MIHSPGSVAITVLISDREMCEGLYWSCRFYIFTVFEMIVINRFMFG